MGLLGGLNWLVLAGVNFPDHSAVGATATSSLQQKQEGVEERERNCDGHDRGGDTETTVYKITDTEASLESKTASQPRSTSAIIQQPLFILSCSVATIAHTVMVMIMSNCALSMKDDYSLHKVRSKTRQGRRASEKCQYEH